jgi:hypothetical protein
MRGCVRRAGWVSLAVLVCAGSGVHAQQPPQPKRTLEITTPPGVVTPGQTLIVTVTAPKGTPIAGLLVGGQDPIGAAVDKTGTLPAHLSIPIPAQIDPGKYQLTAIGATPDRQALESNVAEFDVEYDSTPVLLTPEGNKLVFDAPGQKLPTFVLGAFRREDVAVNVKHSSRVTYTSSDTKVATVGPDGEVTSIAPGTAAINVSYAAPGKPAVHTSIAVVVETPK